MDTIGKPQPKIGTPMIARYKAKPVSLEHRVDILEHLVGALINQPIYEPKEEDDYECKYDGQTNSYRWFDRYFNSVPGLSDVAFVSKSKADQYLRTYLDHKHLELHKQLAEDIG